MTIFISCNENIQLFTQASHSWKYWCFITLGDNIYGFHSKKENILSIYVYATSMTLYKRHVFAG